MRILKTVHYSNSISEFYLLDESGSIIELKYLQYGRIKKYVLSQDDVRIAALKQLKPTNKP